MATDVVIKSHCVVLAIYSSIVRTRKYYSIKVNLCALWKMSKEKLNKKIHLKSAGNFNSTIKKKY